MQVFRGQRVIVIGAGASGFAASRLLSQRGALVWLVDGGSAALSASRIKELEALGITVRFEFSDLTVESWDLGVVSPGVARESGLMQQLLRRCVPVISEIELGFRLSACPVIAITGTNGKTTTTRLVETVIRQGDRKAIAAGNIGLPFCSVVSDHSDLDYAVLEISSFQLEHVEHFKPKVAVLLNLAPDHLDRHRTFEGYCRAKARLFENQDSADWAIIQWEAKEHLMMMGVEFGEHVLTFSSKNPAANVYYERGLLVSRIPGWSGVLYDCRSGRLVGVHNAENLMATLLVGYVLGISLSEMRLALAGFRGESHRFELLNPVGGVAVINDSKATNPDSLRAAIEATDGILHSTGSLWLIAGGLNKQLPFQELGSLVAAKVAGAYLFGQARDEMAAALGRHAECFLVETLNEAVSRAFGRARTGDMILFSPGCASFDQFSNYAERGDTFCSLIDRMRSQSFVENQKSAHHGSQFDSSTPRAGQVPNDGDTLMNRALARTATTEKIYH